MKHSENLKDIAEAIATAQSKLGPALKDSVNPHFKNRYASLQSVWDAARQVLWANGLSVVQTFSETTGETMAIDTMLLHKSGQWIAGTLTMKPSRADPQGIGSAVTYGRRYALAAILGIVADDDDDGQLASTKAEAIIAAAPRVQALPPVKPAAKPVSVPWEREPQGGWRDVKIGFGKKKGVRLGDLDNESIAWWDANYQPKAKADGTYWDADVAFRKALSEAAAEMLVPAPAGEIDDSDVPF